MPDARAVTTHDAGHLARSTLTSCEERGVLAGVYYVAGGLVALVAALDPDALSALLALVGVAAMGVGAAAFFTRRWFTYGATLASSALGPPMIAVAIVAGRGGWASALTAVVYTFVAVHTALVLRWRHALLLLAWSGATCLAATQVIAPDLPMAAVLAVFLLVCGTLSGVITWLVEKMQRQAATDPLTGLANRTTFRSALEHARATVLRTGESLTLVALDLDGFKQVNDSRGHAAGDALLVAAARAWLAELRERDVLARLGGDEFCAVLVGATGAGARRVAHRLGEVVPHGATCSSGVAVWHPGQDLDELVMAADRELYRAKEQRHATRDESVAHEASVPAPQRRG